MAFETVIGSAELPNGERVVVELGENWVAVFRVDGRLYAIEDLCTHDDGPLAEGYLQGLSIECPRHGAVFSLETGKPTFPAVKHVARFAVREVDGEVQVDVEQVLN